MDNRSIFRKFADWFLNGGVMKAIGRGFLLLGVIAALVIAGIGFADMYEKASVAREEAYQKKYASTQKSEFNKRQRENNKALKENPDLPREQLPYPDLPETKEEYVLEELPVVKLDLEAQMGDFITGYLGNALLHLVAGVFVGWVIGNLAPWYKAIKAAGPVRVIAEAFFWAGVVIAAYFLVAGLWEILNIRKSTLPEVGKILMENYLVWSVVALGAGYTIRWMILKLGKTQQEAFEHAGLKTRNAGKVLFVLAIVAFAVMIVVGVCCLLYTRWALGLSLLGGAVVVLAAGWVGGLALESLGTCAMIMEPQVKAAEQREHERRHATVWHCEDCGTENPRSVATCSVCGKTKPASY